MREDVDKRETCPVCKVRHPLKDVDFMGLLSRIVQRRICWWCYQGYVKKMPGAFGGIPPLPEELENV